MMHSMVGRIPWASNEGFLTLLHIIDDVVAQLAFGPQMNDGAQGPNHTGLAEYEDASASFNTQREQQPARARIGPGTYVKVWQLQLWHGCVHVCLHCLL